MTTENGKEVVVPMFGLTRWTGSSGISRLCQDVDSLFDRFFDREDEWIPSRMMRPLRGIPRDLDHLFDDFFGTAWRTASWYPQAGYWPRFEILVEDNEWVLRTEIPGVAPENLDVDVAGNMLTIRGERKIGREQHGEVSRFSRTFTLPEVVDPEKVKATLANGILEIRMPSPPKLARKRVPVEVGPGRPRKSWRWADLVRRKLGDRGFVRGKGRFDDEGAASA